MEEEKHSDDGMSESRERALEDAYEAREKEYRRAVHYLERREQRAGGPANPYGHNEKQYVWIDGNGEPQLCNKPMAPEDARALEQALLVTEAFELDYDQEPWDSFDAPSYEEMEVQEVAYWGERAREITERRERSGEEEYNKLKQGEEEMEVYSWLRNRSEREDPLREMDGDFER